MKRNRVKAAWLAAGAAAFASASVASGGPVRYVDDDAQSGGGGLSWATAHRFLRDAIEAASQPGSGVSEIRVAQGTYLPNRSESDPEGIGSDCCAAGGAPGCDDAGCQATVCAQIPSCCQMVWDAVCASAALMWCGELCPRRNTFHLVNGVSILGGFAGLGAPDPDERNVQRYETALSGDLLGNDDAFVQSRDDNSGHVVTSSGTDPTAVLDGVTVSGGYAGLLGELEVDGGGLYNAGGAPTISNCVFSDNLASRNGGCVYNASGNPLVSGCTFTASTTVTPLSLTGGGMYNLNSSPTVVGCTFTGIFAGHGGAMANAGGSRPTVDSCLFLDNEAYGFGGAVDNQGSSPTFLNCTFESNQSIDAGAAMANEFDSSPILSGCTFTSNLDLGYGSYGGGAVWSWYGGHATYLDCVFTGNSTDGFGGAFAAGSYGGSATAVGCTFDSNSGGGGGAVSDSGASSYVNCWFSLNWMSGYGGGGAMRLSGTAQVIGCSFTGNGAANQATAVVGGGALSITGDAFVRQCTFTGNTARFGGAVFVQESSPQISRCLFLGNSAFAGGGGMYNYEDGDPLVASCVFAGNSGFWGGAVFGQHRNHPQFFNCLFTGNVASYEGGAFNNNAGPSPLLVNCTLSANAASINVGGISSDYGSAPELRNCVVWGNTDQDPSTGVEEEQIDVETGATATVNYSCVQGWTGALGGQGNTGADPLFLDADGADGTPGTADDDLRLSAGSPLIDAGDNGALTCIETDLDDHERFFDDPAAPDVGSGTAPLIDMGPYERLAPPAVTTDCNENGWEDVCETAQGISPDCNGNGSPDECDVTDGTSPDCNLNGVPDECEPSDCNGNGSPDDCDIAGGASGDCNGNGVPDECEAPDCNANGVPDECDIENGTSIDFNENGVPDECDIIHVPGDAPTIQGAINQALHAFTILVAPGVYAETIDFANKQILVLGTGGAEVTTINGQGLGTSVVRFGVTSPPGTTQTLEGFTVTGGNVVQGGGAIVVIGATPTVRSCTFLGNHASTGGGVFVPSGAAPAFLDCTFEGNTAGFGAGLMNLGGTPAITGCLFAGNRADTAGGGIYSLVAPAFVASSTFCENSPDDVSGQWTDGGGNVFAATCPRPCPADLDGDGFVGVIDFLDLLKAWGTSPGGPPDLDGDGIVGVTDFLELLKHWGPCPPG